METKGTRRLDLSATPFVYVKSVDLAEGFLFEYGAEPESRVCNTPSARERFFVEHFGYRMRTGKLTQPDAQVNSALMERQFNTWLKERGALRGRRLEVDKDYSREFIGIDDMVGNKIDEGWEWLRKRAWDKNDPLHEGYSAMLEELNKRFDYHARIQLLEAIKAPHVVERAKKHIALGRKVVLFHSRIKGGTVHPFHIFHERTGRPPSDLLRTMDADQLKQWMASADTYNRALADFRATRADLINLEVNQRRPLDLFADAFGDALTFYNGTIKKRDKVANPNAFNDDDGSVSIIAVQDECGKEGISLHDTTSKSQRVLMNLGLPLKPTQAIQIEGRIYRVGQMSDAIFEYISTGTSFERWTFASKISQRSSTAENLALGEEARALSEAFVDAYENANSDAPSLQQGKGGKERDRAGLEAITPFEKAKTHYFGVQKNNKRRSRREGVDYFATPEPVGFKMVEWANMRSNESALEPSAGHGAIARYFPEDVSSTFVEPSSELLSRLALRAPDRHRQEAFEDLSEAANKFHAIVMNPPYGSGGATAMAHLGKAMHHLRNGGRIVALLPEGPAANKKLENLIYGKEGERLKKRIESRGGKGVAEEKRRLHQLDNFYVMADVGLPPVTFERAGTNVKTHVVIIDRYDDASLVPYQRGRIDLEADNVNELFDKIEGMAAPERADIPMPPAEVLAANELKVEQQGDEWILTGKTFEMKDAIKPIIKKHLGKWDGSRKHWRTLSDPSEDIASMLQGKPVEGVALPGDNAAVAEGGAGVAFDLQQTRHAKKDIDLFVASMSVRVPRDEYMRLKGIAKKHGGYFSSYEKNGAIPGFQFESAEGRQAFIDEAQGDDAVKFSRGVGKRQGVANKYRILSDQSDAKMLNRALVEYGLGKEWSNAYEATDMPDSLSGVRSAVERGFSARVIPVAPTEDRFNLFSGFRIPGQDGVVYVNVTDKTNFIAVTGHELLHDLQRRRPALYRWFLEKARDHYDRFLKYDAKMQSLLEEGQTPFAIEQVEEELPADFVSDALADPGFLQGLADDNPSKFKQLLNTVVRWLGNVKGKLKGLSSEKYFNIVRDTQESAFGPDGGTKERVKGAYYGKSGRVLVIAGNLSNRSEVERLLAHEVLVHHGLNLFSPADKRAVVHQVASSAHLLKPYFTAILKDGYSQQDEFKFAKEVLAYIGEETNFNDKSYQARLDRFAILVASLLRKIGLFRGVITKAQARQIVRDMAESVRSDAPQKTFPKSNDAQFSKAGPATDDVLEKIGLAPRARKQLSQKIDDLIGKDFKALGREMSDRAYEGLLDGLVGIDRAEKAVGVTDAAKSGYIGARLATGVADTMHAILHYGAPEWRDGIVQRWDGTRGLLEVLGDLRCRNKSL